MRIIATFQFELRQLLRQKALWVLAIAALWGTYTYFQASRPGPVALNFSGPSWEIQQSNIVYMNFSQIIKPFQKIGILAIGVALFLGLYGSGKFLGGPIESIVFTKPISNFQLQLGRYLALLFTLVILSLMPILALIYFYSKYRYYVWDGSDFLILWSLGLLWPIGITSAVAWWARSAFRSIILSAGVGLVILGASAFFGSFLYLNPFWFLIHSPILYQVPLGFHLPQKDLSLHMIGNFTLILIFLGGSCFYLRRQKPDLRPSPQNRRKSLDAPNLRSLLQTIIPDRRAGWDAIGILLLGILSLSGLMGWIHHDHRQSMAQDILWNSEWDQLTQKYGPLKKQIDILKCYRGPSVPRGFQIENYDLRLDYDSVRNELSASCGLLIANNSLHSVTEIPLLLNIGLEVEKVYEDKEGVLLSHRTGVANTQPIPFTRIFNQVILKPEDAILPGSSYEIILSYHGKLVDYYQNTKKGRRYFERSQTSSIWQLTEKDLFYPLLPQDNSLQQSFFTAVLSMKKTPGTSIIAPGEQIDSEDEFDQWRAVFPLTRLFIVSGPFKEIRMNIEETPVRMYSLPGREEIARVFIEDIALMLRDTLNYLGPFPYPELILYDNVDSSGIKGPGIIPVSLDALLKSKSTLDTFYERFSRVLNKRQYYLYVSRSDTSAVQDAIADLYFKDSVHPTGSDSILLSKYFPYYLRTVLFPGAKVCHWQAFRGKLDVKRNQRVLHLPPLRQLLQNPRWGDNDYFNPNSPLDRKAIGLFHMLRYLMKEDSFQTLLHTYLKRYHFQDVQFTDFQKLATELSPENLEGFFEEWMDRPLLPDISIRNVKGLMYDDPHTLGMDYHVSMDVINEGTGQVIIPIYLKTEGDDIITNVPLNSGEEKQICLDVPDRPLFASVDPEGWVLQVEHYYEKGRVGRINHPVEIIEPRWDRNPGSSPYPISGN